MRRPADKEVVDTQEEEPEVEPAVDSTPPDEDHVPELPLLETLCDEMECDEEDDTNDPLAEEEAPDPLEKSFHSKSIKLNGLLTNSITAGRTLVSSADTIWCQNRSLNCGKTARMFLSPS